MSRKKDIDLDLTGFAELFMNDEGRAKVACRVSMIFPYLRLTISRTTHSKSKWTRT